MRVWTIISIYIILFSHWQSLNIGIDRILYGFPIERYWRPVFFISPILFFIFFNKRIILLPKYLIFYMVFILFSICYSLIFYEFWSTGSIVGHLYLIFNIALFYMVYYSFVNANLSFKTFFKVLAISLYLSIFLAVLHGLIIYSKFNNVYYLSRFEGIIPEANSMAIWFAMVFFIFYKQKGYLTPTLLSFLGICLTSSKRVFIVVFLFIGIEYFFKVLNRLIKNNGIKIKKYYILMFLVILPSVVVYFNAVNTNIFTRLMGIKHSYNMFGEGNHMFIEYLEKTYSLYGYGIGFLKGMYFTDSSSRVMFLASYQDILMSTGVLGLICYLLFKMFIIVRAYIVYQSSDNTILRGIAVATIYYVILEIILGVNTTFWSFFGLFFMLGVFEYVNYKVRLNEYTIHSK